MNNGADKIVDEATMQTMSVAPPGPEVEDGARGQGQEGASDPVGLDAELDQSMDASDPPSQTQPGSSEEEQASAHPS